jgi:hypothetical protein
VSALPRILTAKDRIGLFERIESIKAQYQNHRLSLSIARSDNNPPLYPVQIGKLYGYMDGSGKVVIPPRFEEAGLFREGMAVVWLPISKKIRFQNGNAVFQVDRGFVDRSGNLKFRVNFPQNAAYNSHAMLSTTVGSFQDGRALVEFATAQGVHSLGFIDPSGQLVITPDFNTASGFSEGLAQVELWGSVIGESLDGFIRTDGTFAIEPKFERARSFSEGLAAVKDSGTKKWGYVDSNGSFVIPPRFNDAWDFHEGLALVESSDGRRFISRSGTFVSQPVSGASIYSQGVAAVNVGGTHGDWGDLVGPEIIDGGKWGYMNMTGTVTIAATFDFARPFAEGLAPVNQGGKVLHGVVDAGKWGFIDLSGQFVIAPVYDDVHGVFQDGLALVEKDGHQFYINKSGQPIPPK